MSNLRITANRLFAMEGLRKCFEDISHAHDKNFGNTWLSVDTLRESIDKEGRWFTIQFKVRILGVGSDIIALCSIWRNEHSGLGWDRGSCTIELPVAQSGHSWYAYGYDLIDNKISAFGINNELYVRK